MRVVACESRYRWLSGKTPEEKSQVAVERNKSTKVEEEQTVESVRNAAGGTQTARVSRLAR